MSKEKKEKACSEASLRKRSLRIDDAFSDTLASFFSSLIPGYDLDLDDEDNEELLEWDEDWLRFVRELKAEARKRNLIK